MVDSIINSNETSADIILLGVGYDVTSSFGKGSDKSVALIKNILDKQIEFYNRYTKTVPTDNCKVAFKNISEINKLSPEKMVFKVKKEYTKLLSKNKFIITIGGEHSVSNGPLQALSQKYNSKDVTIVQLDAHFDLRMDDSDYNDKPHGKYAHCAVMRRGHELGFKLIQVGIRAYSKDELDYALQHSSTIKFFKWGSGKKLFIEPKLKDIIDSIKTKYVYISIDVDGFDTSVMPDTGTPVPGGFSWDYGVKLLNSVFVKKNVIGADIVEVAPKDIYSITAYNASQLIHHMIGQYAVKMPDKKTTI